LGMSLDEKVSSLEGMQSNGVRAYIDPELYRQLSYAGNINIDYVIGKSGEGFHIWMDSGKCGI